jgi:hypothetical protein
VGSETRGSFSDPGDDVNVIGMLMASATDWLARIFTTANCASPIRPALSATRP